MLGTVIQSDSPTGEHLLLPQNARIEKLRQPIGSSNPMVVSALAGEIVGGASPVENRYSSATIYANIT
jgi:hypothetical protein